MLKLGLKRTIEDDDIYNVSTSMQSKTNTDILANLWEIELQKKNIWFQTTISQPLIYNMCNTPQVSKS